MFSELGHEGKALDVFKIDCEGCEYGVMPHVLDLVKSGLIRIDQVQIEIHGTDAAKIQSLSQSFRGAGYAVFHKERNHWGCNGYSCVEYAFVSRGKSQEIFKISHCFSERKNSVHTISSKNSRIPSNPLANFNSLNCLGHYENKMFLLQYLARSFS